MGPRPSDSWAAVATLDGHVTRLDLRGTNPAFIAPSSLIYVDLSGSINAAPFDSRGPRVTGLGVPIYPGGATFAALHIFPHPIRERDVGIVTPV